MVYNCLTFEVGQLVSYMFGNSESFKLLV